jgi:hypothetical protein
MKITKEYIKERLVDMHKNVGVDKWGQVHKSNFTPSNIFGNNADAVIEFIEKNEGILSLDTYGGTFGTYEAFSIVDSDISNSCSVALRKNSNWQQAMRTW